MKQELAFPKSFPNKEEELFLRLVLSEIKDFKLLWDTWREEVKYDDLNHATVGLVPFLYMRLRETGVHDDLFDRMKGVYKFTWVKNQALFEVIGRTIKLLNEHDVQVVLLKGLPLLLCAYKDIGARFLSDGDILIKPSDIKKVISIMQNAGWTVKKGQVPRLEYLPEDVIERVVKEITFINQQGIEVDVHWRVFENLGDVTYRNIMLFGEIWETKHQVVYNGNTFYILSPELMLIHVIVHGNLAEKVKTIRFVSDAVMIIRNMGVDWNLFLEKVELYNFNADIYFAFKYLLKCGFISLSRDVEEKILSRLPSGIQLALYYKKTNSMHKPFGGFPRHFRTYWRHMPKRKFPRNLYDFLDYLKLAWGLSRKRDIPKFVFGKYLQRLQRVSSV